MLVKGVESSLDFKVLFKYKMVVCTLIHYAI